MQFLKILFWCLLAFVAALFTYGNWQPVEIHLWAGLEALACDCYRRTKAFATSRAKL